MKKLTKRYHVKHPVAGHKAKMLKVPCKCGHRSTGYSENDFDERVIHEGTKIEYEHTCDKEKAERIAMDHLSEFEDYYTELEKMEEKLKKMKSKSMKDKRPIHTKKCIK